MSNIKLYITLIIGSILVLGCSKSKLGGSDLELDLSNAGELNLTMTKSSSDGSNSVAGSSVNTSDFIIEISSTTPDENGEYEILYSSKYSEISTGLLLPEGLYQVSATLGDMDEFTTTAPTYYDSQDVLIEIGQTSNISLEASIWNYIVNIEYSDEFKDAFTDYYTEVKIDLNSYSFANGVSEAAYLAPSSATVVLKGTTKDGDAYSSVIKEITSEGKEQYNIVLNIRALGHYFEIDVDTEVTDIDLTTELDSELYPEMPVSSYGAMQYYETASIESDSDPNFEITLNSLISIEDVEVQFKDVKFAAYNLDTERAYKLSNSDDIAELEALGMVIGDAVIGSRTSSLNLAQFPMLVDNGSAEAQEYIIGIKVIDKIENRESSMDVPLTVLPPKIDAPLIDRASIWTKQFTVSALSNEDVLIGDYQTMVSRGGFSYQYSTDNATWNDITSSTLLVSGLTQTTDGSTTYYVRAKYKDVASESTSFNLEAAMQIPNSSFETYQKSYENKDDQVLYRWALDGEEWWSSLNPQTCTTSGIDAWYVSQSGTRANSGKSGNGILITTVGWGSGNTWAGYFWSAVVKNITAGRLYIGEYSGGQQNGKGFDSRPTSMTYYYKYNPIESDKSTASIWVENRDGGTTTVIGSGSFTTSSTVSSYTQKTIDITYTNLTLAPTHICIEFQSGINSGDKDYLKGRTTDSSPYATSYYYYGSRFYVDEVVLNYSK